MRPSAAGRPRNRGAADDNVIAFTWRFYFAPWQVQLANPATATGIGWILCQCV